MESMVDVYAHLRAFTRNRARTRSNVYACMCMREHLCKPVCLSDVYTRRAHVGTHV